MENEDWQRYSSILEDIESPEKDLNKVNLVTLEGDSKSYIPDPEYQHTFDELAHRAFSHSISPFNRDSKENFSEVNQTFQNSKSSSSKFEGICMDDGAEKSVAGLEPYKKYCFHTNTPADLTQSN